MKIIGVGKNYYSMLNGEAAPKQPVIFFKSETSVLKKNNPFYFPSFTNKINYEVELAIRINRNGKNIATKFASKYYDQYALCIDFTAADLIQEAREKGLPWDLAKGFNDSLPISQFRPIEELRDVQNTNISLNINETLVQKTSTADMIFKIDDLIAYISQFIFLKMGDIIITGTPEGIGPIKIGDKLEGFVEDKKLLDFEIR